MHSGDVIGPHADFFVPPPDGIGPVISASTTLTTDQQPFNLVAASALRLLAGAVPAFLFVWIMQSAFGYKVDAFSRYALATALGLVGVAVAVYFTQFHHTCSYVGRDGIAEFACWDFRRFIVKRLIVRFREAAELRTRLVGQGVGEGHVGATITLTWTDVGGAVRGTLQTSYSATKPEVNQDPLLPIHFVWAAERAWSEYLLPDIQRRLTTVGSAHFNIDKGRSVEVAEGRLTHHGDGRSTDYNTEDIGSISFRFGVVSVNKPGSESRPDGPDSYFTFGYDKMANVRLFLMLVEKVSHVRVD